MSKREPAKGGCKKKSAMPPKSRGQQELQRSLSKPAPSLTNDFDDVLRLIEIARSRALTTINTQLIELYWSIGEHISQRIAAAGWGKGTVAEVAEHIRKRQPNARGFSAQNLWRMRRFFETYRELPILSTLLREIPWSHNLAIMRRSKRHEEREFYLQMATKEHWSFRELQRQLDGALFERVVLSPV